MSRELIDKLWRENRETSNPADTATGTPRVRRQRQPTEVCPVCNAPVGQVHCYKRWQGDETLHSYDFAQSAPTAATGEWRVNVVTGRHKIVDQTGNQVATADDAESAAQIVADHGNVRRLVAALERIAAYPSGYKHEANAAQGRHEMIHIARSVLRETRETRAALNVVGKG